ncbi:hypothetical protein ACFQ4C_08385 [Larkinella insperata]|uniref:Uncharacterized protein n=1 Tax=Larkinella insperata TaxID=332158 RepID=A0ABW3Q2K3_9BACT
MKSENPGFTAKQVVYVENLGIYIVLKNLNPSAAELKPYPG